MKKATVIKLLVIGLLLSGCARKCWYKDGMDDVTVKKDSHECLNDAQIASRYSNLNIYIPTAGTALRSDYNSCMEAKGYKFMTEKEIKTRLNRGY